MLVYLTEEDNKGSFVKGHQNGGYDVKCIHSIACRNEQCNYNAVKQRLYRKLLLCFRVASQKICNKRYVTMHTLNDLRFC